MPTEEQVGEKIQNAIQTIITEGAKLMLRIPKGAAMALFRFDMKLTETGVYTAGEAVRNKIDSGEMSKKQLQRKKDGDLYRLQLGDPAIREVQHSLRAAGIDYHLEHADQGQFTLYFTGRDEDHVHHAVQRTFKDMGLDATDDDFTVEQTEQTRSEPKPPARRTPAEPAMKPIPTQRITWDLMDPEVMEMATNSFAAQHPEFLWDKLMSDTTCSEQTDRDLTDRVISKTAAGPNLHNELDTILCDDYGQGTQTQGQTRRQTIEPNREKPAPEPENELEPTPDKVRTPATRQQTQARADNPRSAGEKRESKPARSKKALLERSKTRLNKSFAGQKSHMPLTQNRDHTPHKGR